MYIHTLFFKYLSRVMNVDILKLSLMFMNVEVAD
jgi:hypothetical protein